MQERLEAEWMRWNRAQTTGLAREDLVPEEITIEAGNYGVQIIDLAVDETQQAGLRRKLRKRAVLGSALRFF